jgi:hypothetical protein
VEDVVAVAIVLASGERRHVITWGRIQDAVDPAPLQALVLRHASRFALGGDAVAAEVCPSLQSARDEPYFFEALVRFGMRSIPFGDGYDDWRDEVAERMEQGKELYYLGRP